MDMYIIIYMRVWPDLVGVSVGAALGLTRLDGPHKVLHTHE